MASDPIARIQSQIGEARSLPVPEPYVPSGAPLEALLASIDDAVHGREPANANRVADPKPASAPSSPTAVGTESAGAPRPSGPLDALVGQQILQTISGRPLPGPARAEAIQRLAVAMQNPSSSSLEAVLDVLLSGDPDAGQSR